jgi:hypothetical protein
LFKNYQIENQKSLYCVANTLSTYELEQIMFNQGLTESVVFENEREGYLFAYAQMCANQTIRYAEIQDRVAPKNSISLVKWEMAGKRAEMLEIGINAVLSATLFLEAYSFDYVARHKSNTYAKQYFEKLDLTARWILGTAICCPPGLNTSHDVIGRLSAICKLRNHLVHNKSKAGGSFYPPPDLPEEWNPAHCLILIYEFCNLLYSIDQSEVFAKYVATHINLWMSEARRGIFDYPIVANIDP